MHLAGITFVIPTLPASRRPLSSSDGGMMSATLHHDGDHRGALPLPLRRQRLRISNACQACRSRKVKCDGGHPACARCHEKGQPCTYNRAPAPAGQHTRRKPVAGRAPPTRPHVPLATLSSSSSSSSVSAPRPQVPETSSSSTSGTALTGSASSGSEQADPAQDPDRNRACYTAHGRFAGEVAAAIDVRAGLAPASTSNLVPFVDAPLFGEVDLSSPGSTVASVAELPSRPYGDRLVNIYWQYVDPVEPVLDRGRFFHDLDASYSGPGAFLYADPDVWLSILNIVFALAVQRQESTPRQKRDDEANLYFQRAWVRLRPEAILWKPASIELVQCLMLMNRYLHCTNNQQKTWMTAGLAIRLAQTLCCHLSAPASAKDPGSSERRLKQRVWLSCIGLDRCVSWSLGRTSVPSLIPLPNQTGPVSPGSDGQQDGHATWAMELHEIGNQIQLAQTQARNGLAARLGLPRLYQQDEYHAVAVQLGTCLDRWENNLPSDWKLPYLPKIADRLSRAERYLLHLRLLYTRIFLYRPMLARYYSMKTHMTTAAATSDSLSLSDRLLREGARMCVEAAQKTTSVIVETLEAGEPIGLLPWWYRIYYLHIAGTSFLAAMFGSDLFTESVSQSWSCVLSTLRAHEHLSTYVQKCSKTFETLAARILGARQPSNADVGGGVALGQGSLPFPSFEDVFQDMGFDFNDFLFSMEDVAGDWRYVVP